MSPLDVLRVIQDNYRHQVVLNPEAEPDIDLSWRTTVDEWRTACDLVSTRKLGRPVNEWFDILISDEEWSRALSPPRERRLRDVCELIAKHATKPVLRRVHSSGSDDAFLALKSLLTTSGVDMSSVTPSTPLAPWVQQYASELIIAAGRIAPGALPVPTVREALIPKVSFAFACASVLLLIAAGMGGLVWLMPVAGVGLGVGWISTIIASRMCRNEIRFGDLETFGDLSRNIASYLSDSPNAVH